MLISIALLYSSSNVKSLDKKDPDSDSSIPLVVVHPAVTPTPTTTPIPTPEPTPVPTPIPTLEPTPVPTMPPSNLSNQDCYRIFSEKRAMVIGDSMAEGLSAYGVFNPVNVVWSRGRRIDNMQEDMSRVLEFQPDYLFLAYGLNDLEMWNGRVEGFISSYRNTISYLQSVLPNTKIIINSVLPVSKEAQDRHSAFQYQELFNTELEKLASEFGIPFLENSGYLLGKENPYTTDGIHPQYFFFFDWGKHMVEYLVSGNV